MYIQNICSFICTYTQYNPIYLHTYKIYAHLYAKYKLTHIKTCTKCKLIIYTYKTVKLTDTYIFIHTKYKLNYLNIYKMSYFTYMHETDTYIEKASCSL